MTKSEYIYLENISFTIRNKNEFFNYLDNLFLQNFCEQIITFNLSFLRIFFENQKFKEIVLQNKNNTADGVSIVQLIKYKNNVKIYKITGHDIFFHLLKTANLKQLNIAFLGSTFENLQIIKKKINKDYPYINIVSLIAPANLFENDTKKNDEIIQILINSRPDILFVALGCPRQEIWIKENKDLIGAKINVGIGSVLDVYSGNIKRAPIIFQKLWLEWFWRLIHEPIRLSKRYILKDIPFLIKYLFLKN